MSYQFDAAKTTEECVKWIKEWFDKVNPNGKAVLGISGGKDSTVCAALCVKALGKDRVIGVLMPNHIQKDISDSEKICEFLGITHYTVDIGAAYDGLTQSIIAGSGLELSSQTTINMPPRLRMTTLYAVAQSVNGIVINTCNLSEDHVGYSTLYGDFSGSVSLLGRLTVTEVRAMGRYMQLPIDLVEKAPSDGLCGKTDEDNLGFTYAALDTYMRTGEIDNADYKEKIDRLYRQNKFKLDMLHLDTFDPGIEIVIAH